VRKLACLCLLAAALGPAGCISPRPNPGGGGREAPAPAPKPLAPAATESELTPTAAERAATQVARGLLAGRVIDTLDRQVTWASVYVVPAKEGGGTAAPIDVPAQDGYFTIPGLDAGRSYQLVARVRDGNRLLAGSTWAKAPDPRVLIRVSEDFVTPDTPPLPGPPDAADADGPDRKKDGPERKKDDPDRAGRSEDKKSGKADKKPAATIERPTPHKDASSTNRDVAPPDPAPESPPPRRKRPDLKIDVPHRPPDARPAAPVLPPPPAVPERPVPAAPEEAAASPSRAAPPADEPAPVPSCRLIGRRLENFALRDENGQAWEYRRDRKGRLVLLDFWHTRCRPCLEGIAHLNELHEQFGPVGLEVIGIADEQQGTPEDRAARVLSTRGRFHVRYRTLLSGHQGAGERCPVVSQFNVGLYPTLKLIDAETGAVVWESEGLGERALFELKAEVARRLGLRWR
jgi:thiol-disulfide isomerase/thioredoxin